MIAQYQNLYHYSDTYIIGARTIAEHPARYTLTFLLKKTPYELLQTLQMYYT
jgi:hypothetical protein